MTTAADDSALRLVLCVPRGRPQIGFLIAPDGQRLAIYNDTLIGPAVSCRLIRDHDADLVRLRSPLWPRFLGLALSGDETIVLFDGPGDSARDTFRLHAVDADVLATVAARRSLQSLARGIAAAQSGTALLSLLRDGRVHAALGGATLRLLPIDELKLVGARVLASARDRAVLARCLPHDPWVKIWLPGLAHWNTAGRPEAQVLTAPASVDDQVAIDNFKSGPPLGFTLHAMARRAVSPRRVAAVMTKFRNDGPYILDWIAWHRAIGFDHIFVYSNDNDDDSDLLLASLARHGEITWIQSEITGSISPQDKANNHILNMVPQVLEFRWLLTIDSDEFLDLDEQFIEVGDYLRWQERQQVDAIALCWLLFGAERDDGWRDAATPARFLRRVALVNAHIKSFARPNRFWGQHAHFPYTPLDEPFIFRTETGGSHHVHGITDRLAAFAAAPTAEAAWVNHYMFRSCLKLCWKLMRGRADWDKASVERHAEYTNFAIDRFFDTNDPDRTIEDRRALSRLAARDRQHARLLTLDGIQAADTAIKADFERRLRVVSAAFVEVPAMTPKHAEFQEVVRGVLAAWMPDPVP